MTALPPFVGRAAECGVLRDVLGRTPSVALVEGEAGVGKTRLVAELLDEQTRLGRQVLVGRCQEAREPFPLGPFVDALHAVRPEHPPAQLTAVAGVVGRLVPELAPWLPPAPRPLADLRGERHRLFRGLVEVLDALGPAVLVVEDLHWADEASRAFFDFLVDQVPSSLSVVATYRPYALDDAAALVAGLSRLPVATFRARLPLEPLDAAATAEFVAGMLGGQAVTEEFATYLWNRTSGLPFALEEVLRLLADRHALVHAEGRWLRKEIVELGVPAGFAATVHHRLDALPCDARAVVRAAAVLAVPAGEALLGTVAQLPLERSAEGLATALGAALLQEVDQGAGFRHALTSEAVYAGMTGPQRRPLHLRAAQALEEREAPPWSLIAHHYRQADRLQEWLRCAEAAAQAAVTVGDDAAAIGFLQDVVDEERAPADTRARAAVRLGEAMLDAGHHDEAVRRLRGLLERPWLSPLRRGELRLLLGWSIARTGDAAAAQQHFRDSVPELQDDPGRQSQALAAQALNNPHATVDDQLRWLDEAAAAARRQHDAAVVTRVLVHRAAVRVVAGQDCADELAALPADGSTLAETRQLVLGHLNIADSLMVVGRYREAEARLDEGERLGEQFYDCFAEPFHGVRLLLRWARGEMEGLEADARRVLTSVFSPTADEARLILGALLLAQGATCEGRRLLADVVDRADRGAQFQLSCWARGELAWDHLAKAEPEAAVSLLQEGLRVVSVKGAWTLLAEMLVPAVRALAETNDVGAAQRLCDGAAEALRGRRSPALQSAVAQAAAVLCEAAGDLVAAAGAYRQAGYDWEALPRPLHAARAQAAAGRCLLESGRPEGEQALRAALGELTRLGAVLEANMARAVLRAHGLSTYARRGRRGYGEQLSPREVEVAALAVAGKTNREIAQILVLSRHTVQNQMANVLRKTGVVSRAELASTGWDGGTASRSNR